MRFGLSEITGLPQTESSGPLRNGAFNSGAPVIFLLPLRCDLLLPCGL